MRSQLMHAPAPGICAQSRYFSSITGFARARPVVCSTRRCFLFLFVLVAAALNAADDPNFSGKWRLLERESRIDSKQEMAPQTMEVNHSGVVVECRVFRGVASAPEKWSFTTDGKERVLKAEMTRNAVAKWEGAALLINTIVVARDSQRVEMDRWTLSRDKNTLRIQRQINTRGRETESTLHYERAE